MGARKLIDYFIWRYFLRNPRWYGLYNRLRYSKKRQMVDLLGICLCIVPSKEPSYHIASRKLRRSQVLHREVPELFCFSSFLRSGSTFVDCGANVGLWTASIARLTPVIPDLAILAFEANSETFERLCRSCQGFGNVQCINVALSDREDELEMTEGGSSLVFGVAGGWNKGGLSRRVRAMPLDAYLQGQRDILMKIDVEGHEWPVISGARNAIEEGRVRVIHIDGFSASAGIKITRFLRANQFDIFEAASLREYSDGTGPVVAVRR